jgi:hypothetical protein
MDRSTWVIVVVLLAVTMATAENSSALSGDVRTNPLRQFQGEWWGSERTVVWVTGEQVPGRFQLSFEGGRRPMVELAFLADPGLRVYYSNDLRFRDGKDGWLVFRLHDAEGDLVCRMRPVGKVLEVRFPRKVVLGVGLPGPMDPSDSWRRAAPGGP